MSEPRPLVLVIGCGSIGERHVRTFLATNQVRVLASDNRPAICQQIKVRYGIDAVTDWHEALANPEVIAAVIATPAPLHVEMATRCLAAGKHVLIEKPLALSLAGLEELVATRDRHNLFAGIGYVLHFMPALQTARQFLLSGVMGKIKHVAVNSGQHFPDFRPAYREIYYRDRAQGGGAIQDALTHMANAVEWIVGPTTQVYCDAAHQVLEGVTVEDTVCVAARNDSVLASYSLNQFQAPNETRLDFHATNGSVRVEPSAQRWGVLGRGETAWRWSPAPVPDRDLIYTAQARAFLDGIAGKDTALCTLEEGIQTLRFNLAALTSWDKNQPVKP